MAILAFLINLLSGAMLLLFSVRFLRIGIERIWSDQIRSAINETSSTLSLVAKGAGLGFVMQGATVVMLMGATMAGSGLISVASAAVTALGADLGSALVVRFLTLPVSTLGPFLILAGAWLYLKDDTSRFRNYGRVMLGLGLIFLSLNVIRAAIEPVASGEMLSSIVDFLEADWVTALLVGAALTFVMHSSIAALLTIMVFVGQSSIEHGAAIGLMLGCNVGSALLAIWLLRGEGTKARGVAIAVAVTRVACATLALCFLLWFRADMFSRFNAADLVIFGHLVFNGLIVFTAPFVGSLAKRLSHETGVDSNTTIDPTLPVILADAELSLRAMKRNVSHMLEILSSLCTEVMDGVPGDLRVCELNAEAASHLAETRKIYASFLELPDQFGDQMVRTVEFAIRIKRSCDTVARQLKSLRKDELSGVFRFSQEGEGEIRRLRDEIITSIFLAQDTLWTGDPVAARRLIDRKTEVADLEQSSKTAHLDRVRRGNVVSSASSDQHLDFIASLKEINSKLATIGYAIAEDHGGLKKSRVKASFAETDRA